MTQERPDWELIDRYLLGAVPGEHASAVERERVEDYLAQTMGVEGRQVFIEELRSSQSDVAGTSPFDIVRKILDHKDDVRVSVPARRNTMGSRVRTVVPAGLVVAVAAIAFIFAVSSTRTSIGRTAGSDGVVPERVATTRIGQRATVDLGDGATAVLAPQSTLRIRGAIVELSGEALFTLPHTSRIPFVVHAGGTTTRVLGTTFDVRHYPTDRATHVAVSRGKVSVGTTSVRGAHVVTLTRGEIAEATDSSVTTVTGDVTPYTAWTTGHLVFHDAPIAEVLTTVGRWYGVRFSIGDSVLANQHLTASLDFGSRTELLNALRLVLGVTMTFGDGSDSTITLHTPTSRHTVPMPRRDAQRTYTPSGERGR